MDTIDKINLYLAKAGKTGADLSRALGLSNSVYSQWNTKRNKPRKSKLPVIAEYLGVSVEDLLPDGEQEEETKKSPAVSGEGSLSYVDMATKRIWSPAPVSILVAQYGVPSAVLQEIAGCSLPEAERMAIGALPADAAWLSRIADVFQVPLDDITRGFVPLYANPRVAADIALRMATHFPTLADR